MRNEERFIAATLRSIARQDYAGRLEVLIYDGRSDDQSVMVARDIASKHAGWNVLDNPKLVQAAAWNLGILAASGSIVGIVSGHTELWSDYVTRAVTALARTKAEMVGGPVTAFGDTPASLAIACALSSPFGVGGARHHYATAVTDTDTVFMGVAKTATYRHYLFDEAMVRNQDDELSYRMLDDGCRIVCDPSIKSRYHVRSSLRALFTQFRAYGYWKVEVLRRHPRQVRLRQVVPVLALCVGIMSALSRRTRPFLTIASGTYITMATVAATKCRGPKEPGMTARVVITFAVLHAAYGIGFLLGVLALSRRIIAGLSWR